VCSSITQHDAAVVARDVCAGYTPSGVETHERSLEIVLAIQLRKHRDGSEDHSGGDRGRAADHPRPAGNLDHPRPGVSTQEHRAERQHDHRHTC